MPMLDLAAYLDRIEYRGSTELSVETLRALHRAHLFSVPFENLDIHLGRPIICDEAHFLHKIIEEHRGGFCYELNGAFAALLRALGFSVTLLSAAVTKADGTDGQEFDHLCLHVEVPGAGSRNLWLADVGFGDSFIDPLRFEPGLEQPQFGRIYRLTESTGRFQMEVSINGSWTRKYSFTPTPRELTDFSAMCRYQQTSPDSHFTQQRVCTLATPDGRITLSDLKWIQTRAGNRTEGMLTGEEEWRTKLCESFGINLPAPGAP